MNRAPDIQRALRAARREAGDESGQAIILAAVAMLAMVMGVMATINIGQAIHKRIRLQNITDIITYSMAAKEAQLFNYWAFTNRAQASLYNSMMYANGVIAEWSYVEAMFGMQRDFLLSISVPFDFCCHNCCDPPICSSPAINCPLAHPTIDIAVALEPVITAATETIDAADAVLGNIAIPVTWQAVKWGMHGSQQLMALGFQTYLLTGMKDITEMNDTEDEIDWGLTELITALLNEYEFTGWPFGDSGTMDDIASGNPGMPVPDLDGVRGWSQLKPPDNAASGTTDQKQQEAKKVMAEVVSATRHSDRDVTAHRSNFGSTGTTAAPRGRQEYTKLQSSKIQSLRTQSWEWGDNLVSDAVGPTLGGQAVAYVSADVDKGHHQRWSWHPSSGNRNSMRNQQSAGWYQHLQKFFYSGNSGNLQVDEASGSPGRDSNHPFWGIAPFMKYAPNSDPLTDYNQPSTWAFINMKPRSLERIYTMRFNYTDKSDTASIDMRAGQKGLLGTGAFKGLNALSRGQAFYHRPGEWKEHPNFFNPYWRARLAPVGQKLAQILDGAARDLPTGFRQVLSFIGQDIIASEIITH